VHAGTKIHLKSLQVDLLHTGPKYFGTTLKYFDWGVHSFWTWVSKYTK